MNPKAWSFILIDECGESLQAIPPVEFARFDPPPYLALGAPYGEASPFCLRADVLRRLRNAQAQLQQHRPGWRFLIFDAYRPNAVQQFMVDHCFAQMRAAADPDRPDSAVWDQVFQFWAIPSDDPATPPAHSTGAALDISLCDDQGQEIDMGCPIDEFSPRAAPDHFAGDGSPQGQWAQQNRRLLSGLLQAQGFAQHPNEWWHFSYGDQLWAWRQGHSTARYGRADLV